MGVSPVTHLLTSWLVAAHGTDDPRDCQWLWVWHGQWCLDGWQNKCITVGLMPWCLWLPLRLGHSVVGVVNRRADVVFVKVLQGWQTRWSLRHQSKGHL